MTQAPAAPEFVVLTGFLGAGKTTLLADFLAEPEAADTAVIINEAGQINIDGAIIAETGRALPVALLSNGCVCCSVANDLRFTVEALVEGRRDAGLPPFRRIVLECSGLARPSSVLRSLEPLRAFGMPTRIIATIDAEGSSLDVGFEDAVAQLAAAQTIVMTKLDRPASSGRKRARTRISGISPLAQIIEIEDPRERALAAFRPPPRAAVTRGRPVFFCADSVFDHPRITTAFATFPTRPSWAELEAWLENLVGLCGEKLLRLKGIVALSDCPDPILVQGVGTLFSAPRRLTRTLVEEGLVVIARDTPLALLQEAELGLAASFRGRSDFGDITGVQAHQVSGGCLTAR